MKTWKGALTSMALACAWAGCENPDSVGTHMIVNPATASGVAADVKRPSLVFADTIMEFGVVSEGHVVDHVFSFTNQGPGNAVLADVSTTCGCTVAKTWPKTPLAPGERSSIEVTFNTRDKSGPQDKIVAVVANTDPSVTRLHLVGTVVSPR